MVLVLQGRGAVEDTCLSGGSLLCPLAPDSLPHLVSWSGSQVEPWQGGVLGVGAGEVLIAGWGGPLGIQG